MVWNKGLYYQHLCMAITLMLLMFAYTLMFAIYLCTSVCAYGHLHLLIPLMYAYVHLSICLWVMILLKEVSVGL
jgi:hypothetical protein